MKKLIGFLAGLGIIALAGAAAQSAGTAQAAVEISFSFIRQNGAASNQFAVWVEDTQGKYIKTLYATRFTAEGGWKRRPSSIPQWVKQASLDGMAATQVDALTGPTPGTGALNYHWDGTDNQGAAVPAGNYVVYVEASLRWENRVVYRAPVRLGSGAATADVKAQYYGDPGVDVKMVDRVAVRVLR